MCRIQVADGPTQEGDHAPPISRDLAQVVVEVADHDVDVELVVLLGQGRGRVAEELVAHVEGDVARQGARLLHGA